MPKTNTAINREHWLNIVAQAMRESLFPAEYPVPEKVRVTCGFPSTRARKSARMAIGQCYNRESSADGYNEVFISPVVSEALQAADVLAHELSHAADNCEHGHKGPFVKIIRAIGLEGKPTATKPGPEFIAWFERQDFPPYPHAELNPGETKKTQGTRMIKCECEECGYTVRTTRTWLEHGAPHCADLDHGPMSHD